MLTGVRTKLLLVLAVAVVLAVQFGPMIAGHPWFGEQEVISLDASWSPGIRQDAHPVVHTWTVDGQKFGPKKTTHSPWREQIRVHKGAQVVLTSRQSTAGHLVNAISLPGHAVTLAAGQTYTVSEPAIASRF